MSHSTPAPRHPLVECADTLEKALAQTTGVDPTWLRTTEKADLLKRYTTLTSQLEALRLRVLAASSDLALEHADRRAADWLARETRVDKRAAHAQQSLAEALDGRFQALGDAVADGRVHLDQARVIVRALDRLPGDIDPQVRRDAQERLVQEAARFGPAELDTLGERILQILAPEVGDAEELKALQRAEARAEAQTRLNLTTRHDGCLTFTGVLPPVEGAILKTVLEARMSPRKRDAAGGWTDPATGQRLSAERLRGEAFRELVAAIDPHQHGRHGGKAVSMFVTMTLEGLTTGLGKAGLSTGETITAGHARRLACQAGLIPAVLGGRSEVLDLGRTRRLHSPAQRRAKILTTHHCQIEGCTIPAAWCESHHRHPWSRGGHTDHHDHDLYCAWHHRAVHNGNYDLTHHPDSSVTFHRRT